MNNLKSDPRRLSQARQRLTEGANLIPLVGDEALLVPRTLLLKIYEKEITYYAISAQLDAANKDETIKGTVGEAVLIGATLEAKKAAQEAWGELDNLLIQAINKQREKLSESENQAEILHAVQKLLDAADANKATQLYAQAQNGLITVAEHDSMALKTYAQHRAEEYAQAVKDAEDSLAEERQALGEEVAAVRLSHAAYFDMTGEEYTIGAFADQGIPKPGDPDFIGPLPAKGVEATAPADAPIPPEAKELEESEYGEEPAED